MTQDLYYTAQEAAQVLGVNVSTLYSYVSRGFIRTQKVPGVRVSRYWRSDILRFKQRRVNHVDEPKVIFGEDSSISLSTENDLFFRGQNAVTLANTLSFEAMVALLWQMPEKELFSNNAPTLPPDYAAVCGAIERVSPIDKVMMLAPLLEEANPKCFDLTPKAFYHSSAAALRWVASTIRSPHAPSEEPIHLVVAHSARQDDAVADVVRRLLVLSVDNEVDPVTLAVRAAANIGITPYRVIIAGLIAAEGRRGAYGRMQLATRFLDEIVGGANPSGAILSRLKSGEALPGFGRQRYGGRDPRALSMMKAFREQLGHLPEVERFLLAMEVATEATGQNPDFALTHLLVSRIVGLSGRDANLLRLARITGWIAHSVEQYAEHESVSQNSRYKGQLPT